MVNGLKTIDPIPNFSGDDRWTQICTVTVGEARGIWKVLFSIIDPWTICPVKYLDAQHNSANCLLNPFLRREQCSLWVERQGFAKMGESFLYKQHEMKTERKFSRGFLPLPSIFFLPSFFVFHAHFSPFIRKIQRRGEIGHKFFLYFSRGLSS